MTTLGGIACYVGKTIDGSPERVGSRHTLETFDGKVIGTCQLKSSWAMPLSFTGSRMYSVRAVVKGREYHGKGFGQGMSIYLRPTAAARRLAELEATP